MRPLRVPIPLRTWTDAALSFFYPEVCALCEAERATHLDGFVGPACRAEVRVIESPFCDRCGLPFEGDITNDFECTNCREMELDFCWARSAVVARGPVLEAIHRFKYQRQLWFETFLGELLVTAATEPLRWDHWDALVPVPLFPVKQREREFNQAERLARKLSVATGIPVDATLLRRMVATPSQTRLTRKQRADNMRNAFALRRPQRLKGMKFVMIDDVFTTGATTSACAKILLKAGAERVAVWTLARGV
ncbi:MAG TPA: ComF family protein [Candidatus Acidoferrum sp.]|nr:ComF family protein [Candidatus Acidoferrum sp.]